MALADDNGHCKVAVNIFNMANVQGIESRAKCASNTVQRGGKTNRNVTVDQLELGAGTHLEMPKL